MWARRINAEHDAWACRQPSSIDNSTVQAIVVRVRAMLVIRTFGYFRIGTTMKKIVQFAVEFALFDLAQSTIVGG